MAKRSLNTFVGFVQLVRAFNMRNLGAKRPLLLLRLGIGVANGYSVV